ncbi:MAG: DUF459 domain-containing protein [Desertimonas sp.]
MSHPTRRPRPRATRQQYLVRRVVVAGAAVVLVGALVWALTTVIGGGDQRAEGETTTSITVADSSARSTIVPIATPVPASEAPAVPTAADPARVLVVGDSDAGTFGPYLKVLLDQTGVAETTVDYKSSSGLSRPDFFDWPARLRDSIAETAPDIIVVTFGGNDAQDIRDANGDIVAAGPTGNEAEWTTEYVRRANEVLDIMQGEGRTVIWVGIPNDDNPDVTARMAVQDQAARQAVEGHPGVTFVDTWARFSGRSGGWAEYVIDPRDGQGKDVRADDGFHLNEVGAEILALDIARLVEADLRARGASW